MTTVKTAKAKYTVEKVSAPADGPTVLHVRGANGRTRKLTRKDTGTARFNAAIADFLSKFRSARNA